MASRTASKKWKSSMFVVSAYWANKEALLDGLVNLTTGPGSTGGDTPLPGGEQETFFFKPAARSPEETRAGAEIFLDHVMGTVEHRATVLIDADHAKLGREDVEALRRFERDDIAGELRQQYIRQRDAFVKLFDEVLARRAGFESNVESEPTRLAFQVRRAIDGLSSGLLVGDTFDGVTVDVSTYGKALGPKLLELESVLHQINFDLRTTQGRLWLKEVAKKAHDEAFSAGARCLEAAFRLAGIPELADRVRPSERRPGRREDEVIDEEEEGPSAADFEAVGAQEPQVPGESDEESEEPGEEPEGDQPEGSG